MAIFSQILKNHFQILHETVDGKPYAVRYVGSPYDCTNEECQSRLVYAHGKAKSEEAKLSPLNILAVLEKFDISVDAYVEALAGVIQIKNAS